MDAASFVPQSRARLFVIGKKGPTQSIFERKRTYGFFESDLRPKALANFIFANEDINWDLSELPSPPIRTVEFSQIIEPVPSDSNEWWSRDRREYLLNQMSPRHREAALRMIQGPEISYGTVFRRVRNSKSMAELRTDGTAGCLRTPKGGSGRQILFAAGLGDYRVRLLNPRECARLMGADDFRITVPANQALFGFGDAVCVPVIEWIAKNYLNPALEDLKQELVSA
jgi:DNA (cytosine-5)-methyltransferase 1